MSLLLLSSDTISQIVTDCVVQVDLGINCYIETITGIETYINIIQDASLNIDTKKVLINSYTVAFELMSFVNNNVLLNLEFNGYKPTYVYLDQKVLYTPQLGSAGINSAGLGNATLIQ